MIKINIYKSYYLHLYLHKNKFLIRKIKYVEKYTFILQKYFILDSRRLNIFIYNITIKCE